ncbi:hypothetical protein [Rodentibacter myodis]|uniref:Uncharacterized protein n=1 Tax=Rodentibacter myodis TaxID=1907939 RepID=A0A1V3JLG5_9PAST|nr:hypothetical protein [Rodentibacter myodis]OOF57423.1 hypothetical protein BKL49_08970 [Rodentibacter myodis]
MIYEIEYTYPEQKAFIGTHFVEASTETIAVYKAKAFISEQLYYRFGKDVDFEIKVIDLLK